MRFAVLAGCLSMLMPTLAARAQTKPVPNAPSKAIETARLKPGQGETRALLVTVNGRVVAEHFDPGYEADTRFVSWSMAKTVTSLALGLLVDDGKIDIDQPAPVAAWRTATDGRQFITTRHLLTMTSGLQHQEGSEGGLAIERADTVRLLFTDGAQDAAAYAASRPLQHKPGTHWQYSTATTMVLADIITDLVIAERAPAQRRAAMAAWFKSRLWDPLGITSAEWDFDAAGLFLGGSMLHMSIGDYARLGQLLLDRGKAIDGRRLLSEAWMDTMLAKAAAPNNNQYAGQIWLNTGPAAGQAPVLFHPRGGADTMAFIGHLGQYIVIAPAKRAVIVRLGKSITKERAAVREALADIIDAIEK